MTAKQRVLKQYPHAEYIHGCIAADGRVLNPPGLKCLGESYTPQLAWADAAEKLRRTSTRTKTK